MIRPAFPTVQAGKDVLIGILPFFHIYGGSLIAPHIEGRY